MISGGMTAAARRLGVSQPAISRLVRDLEKNLGLKLFERDGVRLAPRDEALKLHREVERLYVGLDQIARIGEEIRAARGGILRIGAAPSLSACGMEDAVGRLAASRPDLAIIFDTESSSHIAEMVAIQHYDVGVVLGRPEQKTAHGETLAETDAVCIAPLNHPIGRRAAVTARDLMHERMILPGRRTPLRISLDAALVELSSPVTAPIETSLNNCCRLVARGLGVAIVDILSAAEFANALIIRPFRPRIVVRYAALLPPKAPRSLVKDDFITLMREAVQRRIAQAAGVKSASAPVSARRSNGKV